MTTLPMFPLGSVLFPFMPLQLRVFEARYLTMLQQILADEPAEFGVVLIERGQEVGGGEHRFGVGTVAQIVEVDTVDGFVAVVAQGRRRIEVLAWLDDDPYPQSTINFLPDLVWTDDLQSVREAAERAVRSVLAVASEFTDDTWPSDIELAPEPIAALWQLAAITPVGPLDQVRMLKAATAVELMTTIIELCAAAGESFRSSLTD
ncbi:MAG: LON peptidase substrate-binding domain-containing protein [Microbacteriaceae bacterium]|nr:LON peptidase substrate-binding domain-containing protein [Microbacteriaceae bacterium]